MGCSSKAIYGAAAMCAMGLLGLVAAPAVAQTPGFHLIGTAPGTTFSTATAVSADGRVATGYSGLSVGYVWSEATGRYDFGRESGVNGSQAYAISGDGTSVTGGTLNVEMFRWNGPGTYQRHGTFGPYTISNGLGISGDGSVVVGEAHIPMSFSSQAFRWTQATGMVGLGFTRPGHTQSEARAISRDGNTIVGWSQDFGSGATDAFAWTQATGMQVLPQLPGSHSDSLLARGVNHDGSRIVGYDGRARRGVLWTPGGAIDLGIAPNWTGSEAFNVSDSGEVILGALLTPTTSIPAVWTSAAGFVPFNDFLALNGISIPSGYTIRSVNGMSGDGRTFCGGLTVGSDPGLGFVVTIPGPTTQAILIVGATVAARRRRRV